MGKAIGKGNSLGGKCPSLIKKVVYYIGFGKQIICTSRRSLSVKPLKTFFSSFCMAILINIKIAHSQAHSQKVQHQQVRRHF